MDKRKAISKNINLLTSILINILVLPALFIMLIFQQTVNLYLKLKHGKEYAGLMKTWDAITYLPENPEAPNILFGIIEIEPTECDENGIDQTLLQTARYRFDKSIKSNKGLEKLTYTKHRKFGYAYWKKIENFNINNHIKRIELPEDQTIGEYASTIVNKNIEGIWELLVCDKISEKRNKLYLLMKIHHCIGDAVSTYQILMTCLLDTIVLQKRTPNLKYSAWNLKSALLFLKWPCYVYRNLVFQNHTSVLHPPVLSNNKGIVWKFGENEEVLKVKYVKISIPGLTFSGVLHTAISVAIYKYIEKYKGKDKIPEFIYITASKQLPGALLSMLDPEKTNLELRTLFEGVFLKLVPPDLPVKEKLETVCKDLNDCEPGESLVVYKAMKFLSPLIIPFMKHQTMRFEMVTSNVPGATDFKLDGRGVRNIAGQPNNMHNIGLTMGITSNGNRLNIGMIFDKTILETEEEAKEILSNIYSEIDDMFKNV